MRKYAISVPGTCGIELLMKSPAYCCADALAIARDVASKLNSFISLMMSKAENQICIRRDGGKEWMPLAVTFIAGMQTRRRTYLIARREPWYRCDEMVLSKLPTHDSSVKAS